MGQSDSRVDVPGFDGRGPMGGPESGDIKGDESHPRFRIHHDHLFRV